MGVVEDGRDGVLEVGEGLVVLGVERLFLRELPEAFDEIQVWRIGRKEEKLDSK